MKDRFAWRGGSELLLRHGEGAPVTLVIVPALFEEANRMRRFTISLMRGLAVRGIGTVLPDLPGTGESLTDLSAVTLADWIETVAAVLAGVRASEGRCLTIAIRGGAILDSEADHSWRLAPESGERVLRDLVRATALSTGALAAQIDRAARSVPTMLAGQTLSPELYEALAAAPTSTANRRIVRLTDDAGPRDFAMNGSRLWRSAEPGDDPAMVQAAVDDIIMWVQRCAV